MAFRIKKYFQVFWHFQKINTMKTMAYPMAFFISCIAAFLTVAFNVLFIKVNFSFVNNIAGWTFYEALGVVGTYMIIEGAMWVFCSQLNAISSHIQEGTMDGVLLKPIDSQFLVSFWKGDLEDSMRAIVGIILIVISIKNTIGLNLMHIGLYITLLLSGLVIFYSLALVVRSFSFWVIDGSGFWLLLERISGNSQYPVDIYYNKIVKGVFTFVVPLAFLGTVPARALTGQVIDWKFTALSFLMSILFFVGSRAFWKFSLKHYSSASS